MFRALPHALPLWRDYPRGLLVVQNGGEPPDRDDTSDVNGCGFDGSLPCRFVDNDRASRAMER